MKKKILVCDDEESIRLLLHEALKENYHVTEAVDGREALRLAKSELFDLIIIDIKMPGTHGVEVIEHIRENNKNVPIIVCSAYRLMDDDNRLKSVDVTAFIAKPLNLEALKQKVSELIG